MPILPWETCTGQDKAIAKLSNRIELHKVISLL